MTNGRNCDTLCNEIEERHRDLFFMKKYAKNIVIAAVVGIVVGVVLLGILVVAGNKGKEKEQLVSAEGVVESSVESSQAETEGMKESEENLPEESSEDASSEEASSEEVETSQASSEEENGEEEIYAEFVMGDHWGNDGNYNYKFDMTVVNDSEQDISDWVITITGGEYSVESSWNCEISEKQGDIEIKPVNYTSEVTAGGRTKDMGIILKGKDEKASNLQGTIVANAGSNQLSGPLVKDGEKTVKKDNDKKPEENKKPEETKKPDEDKQPQTTKKPVAEPVGAKGPAINVGDRLAGHTISADSPLGKHGRLYVDGANLLDQNDEPYQMHGISTHGLAWFPTYVCEEGFRTFKNDWNVDVMRLAMYTSEYGGYCNGGDKKQLKQLIDNGIEYASKLGMYVIVDWHILSDNNPNDHKREAIEFFDEVSAKYADYGNIIYEICNEPNGGTKWSDVKSYAVDVIDTIRANDPYALILVGTPQWSQLILDAAADPIKDENNIMYTMHFYAATHKDDLRQNLETAVKKGMPVFVSECSICDASGNGGIDYDSAEKWKELLDQYKISYVAWSACNKGETSALIKSNCGKTSDWSDNELSDTGKWYKKSFTGSK